LDHLRSGKTGSNAAIMTQVAMAQDHTKVHIGRRSPDKETRIRCGAVTSRRAPHPISARRWKACQAQKLSKEKPMKKIFSILTFACVLALPLASFAQDQMKQDDMKKDEMKQDQMKDPKSDAMKKDKKSKKASKKTAKQDEMKHDDMKKDEMKKDDMSKDNMKQN
jgi:pentapeptide MXKDX repeat protein